jgi:hypothetical protein
MENIRSLSDELNSMISQGKIMEAFEKFYAPDVVMQENGDPPTVGKDANRKREEDFFGSLIDFQKPLLEAVAYGPDLSMAQWTYDYTHKDLGRLHFTLVAVQHWRNGLIVKEQFYFGI